MISSKLVAFTSVTSALTVLLSFVTIPFLMGVRIHFFQLGIMVAGVVGGPVSGLVTGALGGLYVASLRSDPTIVVGNGLLGLFTGLLARKVRPALAAIGAWGLVQAPWIYLTGTFVFQVPPTLMQLVLVLLTIEDTVCAMLADVLSNYFHLRDLVIGRQQVAQG